MRFARLAALSFLAGTLAACASTGGNAKQLPLYLENAASYYDAGEYQRAYQQWQQALDIEPSNPKARLGQAWALYQLGRGETPEAVGRLSEAEQRLDEIRRDGIGDQTWKAELGFACVHQRWLELCDRKLRKIADQEKRGVPPDETTRKTARDELARHLGLAEASFRSVLDSGEREPVDRLTCWVGLAQTAAFRGDYPKCLEYARLYEGLVLRSKELWRRKAQEDKANAPAYEQKLAGAELQEADLRDLMGDVLYKMGRFDEADAELTKVVEIVPERAVTYLNRGILRIARGDYDRAKADLRKFLSLTSLPEGDPAITEATRRLAECERLLAAEDAKDAEPPANRR